MLFPPNCPVRLNPANNNLRGHRFSERATPLARRFPSAAFLVTTSFILLTLCSLTLMGCGNLDPPPLEPPQDELLADIDVDEMEGALATVEEEEGELVESPPKAAEGVTREQTLIVSVTIFVLAVFVGFEVITKVPPTLHTPLMSGSNAISGITLVGAALMAGSGAHRGAMSLGTLAVILATINVVGGFLVTDRMLGMFKKR